MAGIAAGSIVEVVPKGEKFRRLILFIAITALAANAAQNNCPSSSDTIASRTFTGGPTYTNITVPGSGTSTNSALSNANSENGSGLGCTAVNLTFNNFTVSSSGTNENTLPNGLAEGNAGATYLAQINPDELLFSSLQGNGSSTTDGSAEDGVDNYKVNNSESMTAATSFTVTDAKSGLTSVTVSVNDITVASGASGAVSLYVCEGGTFTGGSGVNPPTGCSSGGILLQDAGVALVQEAVQSITLNLPLNPATIDVEQIFTLTSGTGTNETGFLTWDTQFGEAPEPATLALIGTGLIAVAAVRRRPVRTP